MDQIIKYSDIKVIGDITKKFANIPITVENESGIVKFTIPEFDAFKQCIYNALKEYDNDFIITDDNVSAYEKDAAQIKKLIDKTKKDSKEFVNKFADVLTNQVKIINELLGYYYEKIHTKTKAFRDVKKAKRYEDILEIDAQPQPTGAYIQETIAIPVEQYNSFIDYCKNNNIKIIKEN